MKLTIRHVSLEITLATPRTALMATRYNNRVPHLRDSLILAKVGIRVTRETLSFNSSQKLGCPILCSLTAKDGSVRPSSRRSDLPRQDNLDPTGHPLTRYGRYRPHTPGTASLRPRR